jgi:peptide/nickel transport system ATP-binding protein
MDAVPRLTGGGVSDGIPGRIPDYLNPPPGCRFHPRCPHAMDICRQEKPPFYKPVLSHVEGLSDNHEVACFLYRDA